MKKVIIKTVEEWQEIRMNPDIDLVHNYKDEVAVYNNNINDVHLSSLMSAIKYERYYYIKQETVPLSKEEIFDLRVNGAVFLNEEMNIVLSPVSIDKNSDDEFYLNGKTWQTYCTFIAIHKYYSLNGEIKPLTKEV